MAKPLIAAPVTPHDRLSCPHRSAGTCRCSPRLRPRLTFPVSVSNPASWPMTGLDPVTATMALAFVTAAVLVLPTRSAATVAAPAVPALVDRGVRAAVRGDHRRRAGNGVGGDVLRHHGRRARHGPRGHIANRVAMVLSNFNSAAATPDNHNADGDYVFRLDVRDTGDQVGVLDRICCLFHPTLAPHCSTQNRPPYELAPKSPVLDG